jgi:hypothetical protein
MYLHNLKGTVQTFGLSLSNNTSDIGQCKKYNYVEQWNLKRKNLFVGITHQDSYTGTKSFEGQQNKTK